MEDDQNIEITPRSSPDFLRRLYGSGMAMRTDLMHVGMLTCMAVNSPLLPCSGVYHRAGVCGGQPADPAGGAAVQRAGLDVLALCGCAMHPGQDTRCCVACSGYPAQQPFAAYMST